MEHEPTTVYECCLDVSCVEPPPIIPMDFFARRRSTKGGIPMTATKSDLESATLLSFTMDNKWKLIDPINRDSESFWESV